MAEILKSRFGFLKKNASSPKLDSGSALQSDSDATSGGMERRRETATHVHTAHQNEFASTPPPGVDQDQDDSPSPGSPSLASTKAARDVSGLAGFNLDDLAGQGKASLEAARAEVRRMIADAKAQVQSLHEDAKRQGFAEGKQQAQVDFERRVNEAAESKSTASVATMKNSVAKMQQQLNEWMSAYNDHLNHLIIAATERIVGKKLQDEPELIVRWTADALQATRSATKLVIAVHPDTLVNLGDQFETILQWSELPEQTEVRPDESVAIGDVSIRQTGGEIRAGLTAQIQRLAELLA